MKMNNSYRKSIKKNQFSKNINILILEKIPFRTYPGACSHFTDYKRQYMGFITVDGHSSCPLLLDWCPSKG